MGQVVMARITPECRISKGTDGAWDEAISRLHEEYLAVCDGWIDASKQPTLILTLNLVRP
jgi:hypothetical protein